MKNTMLIATIALGLSASAGFAETLIYLEDFSAAPTVNNTIDNGNTNYGGTGEPNDMNQNEWYTRGTRSTITHINGAIKIDNLDTAVWYLMDLTDLANPAEQGTMFKISFDVLDMQGDATFHAFAGGGLDYAGATQGRIYFRMYGDPPSFVPQNGATGGKIVDEDISPSITNEGTFVTAYVDLTDLDDPGDFVAIAFGGGADSITIDNLQIISEVPSGTQVWVEVPDPDADEEGRDPGTIRIVRDDTTGDLEVNYALGGTASTDDYSESYTGTATITDGNSFVDLVFTPVDDSVYESNESIQLDLIANFGTYQLGTPTTGSITVADNESAPPTVSVSVPDAAAAEQGSDPGTIRISRGSETSGELAVLYTLSGMAGSADYTESHTGTATIADGNSSVDLVFTPVDDSECEGDEIVQLDVTPNAAYFLGTTTGSITITDNEVTAQGTPESWLDLYGLVTGGDYEAADLLDFDNDGKLNHEEYDNGSNPTGIKMPDISFTLVDGGIGGTDTLTFAPPNTGWVVEASVNGTDWGVLPLVTFVVDKDDGTVTASLPKPVALNGGGTYRVTETRNTRKLVVFLAEGQSNMVGWANKSSYDMDDYPCPNLFQLSRGHTRAQYDPGTANSVIRAFMPIQTTQDHDWLQNRAMASLDFYFAREYAKDHPDVDVLIVKNAEGNTAFNNGAGPWGEGNRLDLLADPYLSAAATALAGQYDTMEFGGLLWHQGESDSSERQSPTYAAQLAALFAQHRAVATNYFQGVARSPVILGTMSQDWIGTVTNAACTDLSSISAGLHFSADQYQQIGEMYYDTYRTLLDITRKGTSKAWLDSHDLVTGGDFEAADLLDSDGDGRLNWVEFRDGTNPTNAASLLEVTDLSLSGNQLNLEWQAVSNKTYTMWFTPDLVNKAWLRKSTGLVGSEPTSTESVQVDGDAGFYTVEAEQ
jgi:hypothetical protein